MARPSRDAVQAYMNITDATEEVAFQRLEEHGGNLAQAVNAHFGQYEGNITSPTSSASTAYDFVEDNHHVRSRDSRPRGLPSLISAARGFRPSLLLDPGYRRNILKQISGSASAGRPSPGVATGFPVDDYGRSSSSYGSYQHDNNAEEEMIRAAIEASKKDAQERHRDRRYSLNRDPSEILSPEEVAEQEDEELARALSLSLEELENAMREQTPESQPYQVEGYDIYKSDTNENGGSKPGSSLVQHRLDNVGQKQRSDNRTGHEHHLCHIEDSPYPKELDGIPSEELDKALVLETAFLRGTENDSSHNHLQRRHLEGQSSKTMANRGEPERSFLKESLLPLEPSSENEDAITLLIRMPDSSRHSRRFLKSDKLKHLFYFIDSCEAVKTGTYKVVRPYPRHAFGRDDGALTFEELGLTNKQEALFLELI